MKIQTVLFDLDGTLIDSRSGIFNCFRYAFTVMKKRIPSDAELYSVIGPPLDQTFRNAFGLTEEEAVFALKTYRERYREKGVTECEPIDYAGELLKNLHGAGYCVLMATSKPEPFAEAIVKNLGWTEYFDSVCGSDFEITRKTKSDVIKEALRRVGETDPAVCLMVGDRKYDVEGGKACGAQTLIVQTGFAADEEVFSCGADFVKHNLKEVWDFLKK